MEKPLNKQELVLAVADEADLPKAKPGEVVDAVFSAIEKALKNKQELVVAVADEADLPKAKAGEVVDAVFSAIEKALKNKQEVRLVGFGTFMAAARKAAKERNPRTGEEIDIPASTSVRFKPGKTLKDAVS